MLSFLVCFISFLSHSVSAHYGCGADRIQNRTIRKNLNSKPVAHGSLKKHIGLEGRAQDPDNSGSYSNIRMHYDVSQLQSDWAGYDKLSYFVNDVIPAAFEWMEQVISVRPGLCSLFSVDVSDVCFLSFSGMELHFML